MEIFLILFLSLSGLIILDFLTTDYIIQKYGLGAERIPDVREVAQKGTSFHIKVIIGKIILIGILSLMPSVIPFLLPSFPNFSAIFNVIIEIVLIIAIIFYCFAQINNFYQIFSH